MTGTSLIPLNTLQQCAMTAIHLIEVKKARNISLPDQAYAKAFFRAYTGRATVTIADIRSVDASYIPYRGGATKNDFMNALDSLLESRGENFFIPLQRSFAASLFPAEFVRTDTRKNHLFDLASGRDERKKGKEKEIRDTVKQNIQRTSLVRLQFCKPEAYKAWLSEWRDSLIDAGLAEYEIAGLLRSWWASFWITSVRTDWLWCNTLYELLNEMDYIIETTDSITLSYCYAGMPVYLDLKI